MSTQQAQLKWWGILLTNTMRARAVSTGDIAKATGLGSSSMSRWMRGMGGMPRASTIQKINKWAGHDLWARALELTREVGLNVDPNHPQVTGNPAPKPPQEPEAPKAESVPTVALPKVERDVIIRFRTPDDGNAVEIEQTDAGVTLRQGSSEVVFSDLIHLLAVVQDFRAAVNGRV